jgi:hypothetical protein
VVLIAGVAGGVVVLLLVVTIIVVRRKRLGGSASMEGAALTKDSDLYDDWTKYGGARRGFHNAEPGGGGGVVWWIPECLV